MNRWVADLFVAMTLLGWGAEVSRAQGVFADRNLDAVVRKYVFEKRATNQPLVEADVADISTIVGKNKGIKSLAGLEKCRRLALLDLEGNEIEDPRPLQGLSALQSLNLRGNRLRDIGPIASLKNLQYLQLADNQVRDLAPLEKLGKLRFLYLSNNRIQDLGPLAALKGLCSLYADGNELSDVKPLARLEKLESLDLRGNRVVDISSLRDLAAWKYLSLDHNRISDLGVLIEMAQRDHAGARRFTPFWNVSLVGNPLSAEARQTQLGQLRQVSKSVAFEE